eukprot:Sdes_comp23091_c0_seq1m21413
MTTSRMFDLVAFDIDCTLWPYWVDTHIRPPFCLLSKQEKAHSNCKDFEAKDRFGTLIRLYPDARNILQTLKASGYKIAAVSRTEDPKASFELLKLLDIEKYFDYKEIYPGKKTSHFAKISAASLIPYEKMIFFDDEFRNIRDMSKVGVKSVLVENG